MDGYEGARWIVLDCVNVVLHVFDVDSRDFYDLELLWGDCPRINWRKELGLPPDTFAKAPREKRPDAATGAPDLTGKIDLDDMEAEAEDARLEGRNLDDEEGDADMDEDSENDAAVVVELPDESTGSNSVEFVEIDPPSKRRQRGRALYPTTVEEEEDTTSEERAMSPITNINENLADDATERVRAVEREDEDEVAAPKKKAAVRKPAVKKPAVKKAAPKKAAARKKAPVAKKKPAAKKPAKPAKKAGAKSKAKGKKRG